MKETQLATNLQNAVANLANQIGEINNYLAVENDTPGTKEERNKIACQTLDAETALDYLNLIASKCEGLFARIEKIKDPQPPKPTPSYIDLAKDLSDIDKNEEMIVGYCLLTVAPSQVKKAYENHPDNPKADMIRRINASEQLSKGVRLFVLNQMAEGMSETEKAIRKGEY
ncbi:hypothetical protein HMPREF2835_03105 [Actinomyces sp. HMSC072A03]|nr:hypothetical protein HMPREF2835_03105 [Actinomyces sp. HMSC072A03]